MADLDTLLNQWNKATAALPWGVARAFHNVFEVAEEGKTTLVYGADYRDGSPCLVNTVGTMLSATSGTGGQGLPSRYFGDVVSLFDRINFELANRGVNTEPNKVSPMAADIFLHHFCELKTPEEIEQAKREHDTNAEVYVEPDDETMAAAVAQLFVEPEPCNIDTSDLFNEAAFEDYVSRLGTEKP